MLGLEPVRAGEGTLTHRRALVRRLQHALSPASRAQSLDQFGLLDHPADRHAARLPVGGRLLLGCVSAVSHPDDHPVPAHACALRRAVGRPRSPPSPRPAHAPLRARPGGSDRARRRGRGPLRIAHLRPCICGERHDRAAHRDPGRAGLCDQGPLRVDLPRPASDVPRGQDHGDRDHRGGGGDRSWVASSGVSRGSAPVGPSPPRSRPCSCSPPCSTSIARAPVDDSTGASEVDSE